MFTEATPDIILEAYKQGIFPMADSATSNFYNFYRPEKRGQLSIANLHIPKRLKKTCRQFPYQIKINTDFIGVIDGCAASKEGRDSTWINPLIRNVFIELHTQGHAHSVECWQGNELVGGLYGLSIGSVFCGESMFSYATDASKIALVHLTARLWHKDYTILDTQFTNPHLEQFGIYEIDQEKYETLIQTEMMKDVSFNVGDLDEQQLLEKYLSK